MKKNDWDLLKKLSAPLNLALKNRGFGLYDDGQYIFNDNILMHVETYLTKKKESGHFESHKRYIDVQYIIKGHEIIIVEEASALDIEKEYEYDKDIVFYKSSGRGTEYMLEKNDFLILFPGDAHMPCVCEDSPSFVKKIVFKIPV